MINCSCKHVCCSERLFPVGWDCIEVRPSFSTFSSFTYNRFRCLESITSKWSPSLHGLKTYVQFVFDDCSCCKVCCHEWRVEGHGGSKWENPRTSSVRTDEQECRNRCKSSSALRRGLESKQLASGGLRRTEKLQLHAHQRHQQQLIEQQRRAITTARACEYGRARAASILAGSWMKWRRQSRLQTGAHDFRMARWSCDPGNMRELFSKMLPVSGWRKRLRTAKMTKIFCKNCDRP